MIHVGPIARCSQPNNLVLSRLLEWAYEQSYAQAIVVGEEMVRKLSRYTREQTDALQLVVVVGPVLRAIDEELPPYLFAGTSPEDEMSVGVWVSDRLLEDLENKAIDTAETPLRFPCDPVEGQICLLRTCEKHKTLVQWARGHGTDDSLTWRGIWTTRPDTPQDDCAISCGQMEEGDI